MASTYLHKNQGTPTNAKKFTASCWFKRFDLGTAQRLFQGFADSSNRLYVKFGTDNKLLIFAAEGGTDRVNWTTTRAFRDSNAWYHLVLVGDSTESTEADRIKLYINGEQITDFTKTTTNITQNMDWGIQLAQTNQTFTISGNESHAELFDGLISHFHYVDGTAYQASTFGSTDSTTGEWKINTNPTITMGNNGFTIMKDGNTVTDQSSNSNDWTVGAGTLGNTEDNPSNVFPVLNQLNPQASGYTFDGLGSLSVTGNTGDAWRTMYATFGARTGKYYWEQKITNFTGTDPHYIGIVSDDQMSNSNYDSSLASRGYFYTATGDKRNNNSQTSYGNSWTTNDIVGVALDLDNSKVFFSKNGVFQDSGDPANGTNPAYTITSGYTYIPATSTYYNLNRYAMNFGNGSFGTSAIASEGTNASNIGKFEYDVPTGFTALSTKGLNE